jgi:hypothetical protein
MRARMLYPLLLLVSCGPGRNPVETETDITIGDPHVILTTLYSGFSEELRLVIRTDLEWHAFWQQLVAAGGQVAPLPPAVDFSASAVAVAALGTRERSGFAVHIPDYRLRAGDVVVTVLKTSPSPACPSPPVIITPLVVATVARAARIDFQELDQVLPCGQF